MGFQKRSGRWSLRLRLLVLLLVPLISLAGLWALAAFMASRDAIGKYETSTAYQRVSLPGAAVAAALERERLSSAVALSNPKARGVATLAGDRADVDAAVTAFRRSALSAPARRSVSKTTRQRLTALLAQLDLLSDVRAQVDARSIDALTAIADYDTVTDNILRLYGSMSILDDRDVYPQLAAVVSATSAREMVSRESAIVAAALAARRRVLTAPAAAMFAECAYNEQYLLGNALTDLDTTLRAPLERVAGSADFVAFRDAEAAVLATTPGARLPAEAANWQTMVSPLMSAWTQADKDAAGLLSDEARPLQARISLFLYLATGTGLLAMALSVVVSVLFGRNLARELSRLQRVALDLAERRLPALIKRLRDGETVDVEAEAVPVEAGRSKEVADVAEALDKLQHTAVESAVGEARLRAGINQTFLSMAWRSQSLLHRQLGMLEEMEKRATDPDILDDLFALDHLTTRMRRHAEGLVILGGSPPARGWHHPVPVRDILRAAIAEVEQYTRVVVTGVAPAALDGNVVADATHLLAELIENATVFSPPTTQVQVRGEMVANGYAVEVEDRGIGMEPAEFAQANERLANPPEFDLLDGDRLGLFIVARLAARHGIRVALGPSPYGGTRAVVLMPLALVAGDDSAELTFSDESDDVPAWRSMRRVNPPGPIATPTGTPRELAAPAGDRIAGGWADAGAAYRDPELRAWPDDDLPELPRRIRQASLAPQLRQSTPNAPADRGSPSGPASGALPVADPSPFLPPPAEEPTIRPPEEIRSLMAALQRGWQRGRQAPDVDE